MSVPFKFRQHFRDLFDNVANGAKTIAREDLDGIAANMVPQIPQDFVQRFADQCPMSTDGFLTFIAEWQKDPAAGGASFDELAWGYVAGMTRSLLFHGNDDADFKDIKAIVDPMLKPIKLDVGKLYTQFAVAQEGRITVEELLQVFRGIYPANQVSFADVYKWPKGKKSTKKAAGLLAKAVAAFADAPKSAPTAGPTEGGDSGSPLQATQSVVVDPAPPAPSTEALAASVVTPEPATNAAAISEAALSSAATSTVVETKASPFLASKVSPTVVVAAPEPSPSATKESHLNPSFSSSLPTSAAHLESGSFAAPSSFSPPPSALAQQQHYVSSSVESHQQQVPSERPSAAIAPAPSRVAVTPINAPQAPPKEAQQQPLATGAATTRSSTSPIQSAYDRLEPPPIPQSEKAKAAQAHEAEVHTLIKQGASLSSLPPQVVEFINNLDAQRTQLQRELQGELEELSENSIALKTLKSRLEKLQARNNEPSFAALEPERRRLVHRMEQWIYAAKAQQQHARQGVKRIEELQKLEQAAEAINRHELNHMYEQANIASAQHALYHQQQLHPQDAANNSALLYATSVVGGGAHHSPVPIAQTPFTYAAPTAASPAAVVATPSPLFSDPTARICQFFDSMTQKEREIREKEEALDRLRSLERREKKLVHDIHRLELVKADSLSHQKELLEEARTIRDEYVNAKAGAGGSFHNQISNQPQSFSYPSPKNAAAAPSRQQQPAAGPRREPVPPLFGDLDESAYFASRQKPNQQLRQQRTGGVSPQNPFLTSAIAEQQRTLGAATTQVTRRLEEMIVEKNKYLSSSRVV